MTRLEKEKAVSVLREKFSLANVAVVTSNLGIPVHQATNLRRRIKAAGGEYKVAKHTLTRLALEETRYDRLKKLLRGPRGLVFGFEDPVGVAKALIEFADQNAKLQIEGGAVEGQLVAADQVKRLATMPSLSVLQARVARQTLSPGARLAAMTNGPARNIAGVVAALVNKLEAGV
jgi:large subunit ribosomal protein L10